MIGDSVVLGSAAAIVGTLGPGTVVDAVVSRDFHEAVPIIQAWMAAGQTGPIVIHLGSNGPILASDVETVIQMAGLNRRLVLVNASVPRRWEEQVNNELRAAVDRHPNVGLVDWHGIIAANPGLLIEDHVHPTTDGRAGAGPGDPGRARRSLSRREGVVPGATYRIQLHPGFTFDDAAEVAGYLAELGVTHLYTSPFLQAEAGSTHGYDVVDHGRINDELGGPAGHARLVAALDRHGLGLVVDIVPNHMAIDGRANRWWWDVLENGPASRYASYFDIDWGGQENEDGPVPGARVPILGDHYGRVVRIDRPPGSSSNGTAGRSSSATTTTCCRWRPGRSTATMSNRPTSNGDIDRLDDRWPGSTTGWRSGERRARSSTTAGSSTSSPSSVCGWRTTPSSTKPTSSCSDSSPTAWSTA